MRRPTYMLIAGEASGDLLGAELVAAMRREWLRRHVEPPAAAQPLRTTLPPRFIGAGGPRMAEAGVELATDLTRLSVIGVSDVARKYFQFRRIFEELRQLAREEQPDAVIGIDFSGFNRRFVRALRRDLAGREGPFLNWRPRMVQYVSPQVWASRPGRAFAMARDYDLVLALFPFEVDWYATRVPFLPVRFVGHPILDRYAGRWPMGGGGESPDAPLVVLLPGSRRGELARHAEPILGAAEQIAARLPARFVAVLPDAPLAEMLEHSSAVSRLKSIPGRLEIRVGGLPETLSAATLAIASTGTVTMECAYFGVPTIALYKTTWSTYCIGRCIIKVSHLAMPNILAGETLFPEFIQHQATADHLAGAALELLQDNTRRGRVRARLKELMTSLGEGGAAANAAAAILDLFVPDSMNGGLGRK